MTVSNDTTAFASAPLERADDCSSVVSIVEPSARPVPIVFSSPHSGRCYPHDFIKMAAIPLRKLRLSEDFLVDELFASAPATGCWLIRAHRPRAWLDLNREPWELDWKMFTGRLPGYVNGDSPRVKAGLGVIPRIVSEKVEIYDHKLSWHEARSRIEKGYFPYHRRLEMLLGHLRRTFGQAVLIDCHSMPASAVRAMTPLGAARPDVILGDRHGKSCSALVTDVVEHLLSQAGLRVSRNRVYAGGYITERYGAAGLGAHAIQIEINRDLYMTEGSYRTTAEFHHLRETLAGIIHALPAMLGSLWGGLPAAAE